MLYYSIAIPEKKEKGDDAFLPFCVILFIQTVGVESIYNPFSMNLPEREEFLEQGCELATGSCWSRMVWLLIIIKSETRWIIFRKYLIIGPFVVFISFFVGDSATCPWHKNNIQREIADNE